MSQIVFTLAFEIRWNFNFFYVYNTHYIMLLKNVIKTHHTAYEICNQAIFDIMTHFQTHISTIFRSVSFRKSHYHNHSFQIF